MTGWLVSNKANSLPSTPALDESSSKSSQCNCLHRLKYVTNQRKGIENILLTDQQIEARIARQGRKDSM